MKDEKDLLIERLRAVIENKDRALDLAQNRLETIQMFTQPKWHKEFAGTTWESQATITKIQMALKLKEKDLTEFYK